MCGRRSEGAQGRSGEVGGPTRAHGARSAGARVASTGSSSSREAASTAPGWPISIWCTTLEASLRRACGLVSDGETGPLMQPMLFCSQRRCASKDNRRASRSASSSASPSTSSLLGERVRRRRGGELGSPLTALGDAASSGPYQKPPSIMSAAPTGCESRGRSAPSAIAGGARASSSRLGFVTIRRARAMFHTQDSRMGLS